MSCTSQLLPLSLVGKDQSPFGVWGGSGGHWTFLVPCFAAVLVVCCWAAACGWEACSCPA